MIIDRTMSAVNGKATQKGRTEEQTRPGNTHTFSFSYSLSHAGSYSTRQKRAAPQCSRIPRFLYCEKTKKKTAFGGAAKLMAGGGKGESAKRKSHFGPDRSRQPNLRISTQRGRGREKNFNIHFRLPPTCHISLLSFDNK